MMVTNKIKSTIVGILLIVTTILTSFVVFSPTARADPIPLLLHPNSDVLAGWSVSGASSHWQATLDSGDSKYVYDDTGVIDSYGLTDHTSETGAIASVTLYAYLKASNTEDYPTIGISEGASETYYWEQMVITDSYDWYSKSWSTCPWTGNDWTWANIDAITANIQDDSYLVISCDKIYVDVEYEGATNSPPTFGTPSPTNSSINQNPALTWSIPINDPEGNLINWYINCSNGQHSSATGASNGTKSLAISGLSYSTLYRVYVNATDPAGSGLWTRAWYQFTTRSQYIPNPPSSFTATAISRFRIDLSWTKGSQADRTYVEAKPGSYPSSRTDGTNIYNSTGTSYSHTGLSPGQHWYYRSWSWNTTDKVWSSTYSSANTTTLPNTAPNFGTPSPSNGSTLNYWYMSVTWSIPINDTNGDRFNWTIQCNNGQSYFGNNATNGSKSLGISPLFFSMVYTVWVNATDGYGWTRHWYTFNTRAEYVPNPPSGFTATAISRFRIDLSWTKGSQADRTYVEAKPGSYPSSRTDGTNIYNSTGTSYSHTSLSPSQHWYYRAWSFNLTDGIWSSGYAEADATTIANIPPILGTPSPTNGSINQLLSLIWNIPINDPDGDPFNWTIECSNSDTNSSNSDVNGSKEIDISGLSYSTEYTVWVNVTDGYDSIFEWFTFTTNVPPNPPTNETFINGTAYASIYNGTLGVFVSDPDGGTVNVSFYWSNHTLIGTVLNIPVGTNASLYLPSVLSPTWLSHDMTYYWYVNVSDGLSTVTSPIWNFHTSKAWDINEDKTVDYLDVSALVSAYGDTCIPGQIGPDINNDGIVNYLDVSLLVSHYGESY